MKEVGWYHYALFADKPQCTNFSNCHAIIQNINVVTGGREVSIGVEREMGEGLRRGGNSDYENAFPVTCISYCTT